MYNLMKFEILNIKNNLNIMLNPSMFFIVIFVISIINFGANNINIDMANGIFIIGMYLWSTIFSKHILQNDYLSGKIDILYKLKNSHFDYIFTKFMITTIFSCIFYILFYIVNIFIYTIEFEHIFKSIIAIILIVPSFSMISIFSSSCILNNKINEVYVAFIVMPFLIPVIIFCQSMLLYVNKNNDIFHIMLIMIGLNFINIVLFGIMSNYMLRYNN